MSTPQLILSLLPSGALVIELPGPFATRRKVEVREEDLASTAKRILEAQQAQQVEIGLDGAPTAQQVRHWERHEVWPSSACRFCLSEGRIGPSAPAREKRKTLLFKTTEGVEVRRVRAGASGPGPQARASRDAADLGL